MDCPFYTDTNEKRENVIKLKVKNMKKKKEISIIRSSAAEYLTFITATGESDVNAIYFDESVWLTQKMMGLLYNVETHTINYHLKKIFADGELDENAVIRKFRITASDGKNYNTNHYNLKAIIAVGNKVDSPRAVQFRKWANGIIEEFTIKGYTMDDERLKNFGTILTKDYFELVSEYSPTGDQPQAIAQLVQGFREGNQCQTLLGVTGSGKTFTMANVIAQLNKPTLIIAHNKTLAAQLYGEFKEFFPNNAVEYFVS